MRPPTVAQCRRQCAGKLRHSSMVRAGEAADRLYQHTGDWCHVYRCSCCQGWHVGGSNGVRHIRGDQSPQLQGVRR